VDLLPQITRFLMSKLYTRLFRVCNEVLGSFSQHSIFFIVTNGPNKLECLSQWYVFEAYNNVSLELIKLIRKYEQNEVLSKLV
jgi:hypothetical protein